MTTTNTSPGHRGERQFLDWVKEWIKHSYLEAGIVQRKVPRNPQEYHRDLFAMTSDKKQSIVEIILEMEAIANHLENIFFANAQRAKHINQADRAVKFSSLALAMFSLMRTESAALLLLSRGFDSVARQNLRCLNEMALITCRLSFNHSLAEAYMRVGDEDTANMFWHKHVSKQKSEKEIATYCAKNTRFCPLIDPEWSTSTAKMLGVAVHPNGLASRFPYVASWSNSNQQAMEDPTEFCLSSIALTLAGALYFLLTDIDFALGQIGTPISESELEPMTFDKSKASAFASFVGRIFILLAGLTNQAEMPRRRKR